MIQNLQSYSSGYNVVDKVQGLVLVLDSLPQPVQTASERHCGRKGTYEHISELKDADCSLCD